MTLRKTDETDRIIYESDTTTVILWKDSTNLHFEIITSWPVPEYATWQEYATGIETADV